MTTPNLSQSLDSTAPNATLKRPNVTQPFRLKPFLLITLLVSIWVNLSEVFRYFVIVMPATRRFLAIVPNVAPMNWTVFSIWGLWDSLLTALIVGMLWLVTQRFGYNWRSIFLAGTVSWAFFFILFWVGMVNMNLTTPQLALIALPLAWVETVVASLLASWLFERQRKS